MGAILNFLLNNKESIGLIFTFITIVIPLGTFLYSKNREQRQIIFERFHKDLMKGLSNLDKNNIFGLQQQIAIIYELRKYREYYPVIRRILEFEITRWKDELNKSPHFNQLIYEANDTLNFINRNALVRLIDGPLLFFNLFKKDNK